MKNPWKSKSKQEVYQSPWIQVYHEEVITPNNTDGVYGWIHYKHLAVGVVPIDHEGNTWLVGQYRYPHKEYTWEIPEGGGRMDEDPIQAVSRELLEETGLIANKYTEIQRLQLSNSASDETAILYLATELEQHKPQPDETEKLEVRKVHINEAISMVLDGRITDAMSVAALLKVNHLIQTNQLQVNY